MSKVARWLLSVTLAAAPAVAGPGLNAVGCLGEAHYVIDGDMIETTILPQAGFTVDYRTTYLSPFITPTIGYYYGRPVLEGYLGLEVGRDFAWARPAFTAGIGAQTYNRKDYPGESAEYRREQEVSYPIGIGFRVWLFQVFYGEWQGRLHREERGGVPYWKMEFGYKLM